MEVFSDNSRPFLIKIWILLGVVFLGMAFVYFVSTLVTPEVVEADSLGEFARAFLQDSQRWLLHTFAGLVCLSISAVLDLLWRLVLDVEVAIERNRRYVNGLDRYEAIAHQQEDRSKGSTPANADRP